MSFFFRASVSEYEAASVTAFTASSTGLPRGSVMDRSIAETSCPAFFASVFGRSSPAPPTGAAAPAFVPGAIAATSHAMRMMKPAEAACAPGGATQPTTGTGDARIACAIVRVESRRPPGVSILRTTNGAPFFSASFRTRATKAALTAWISVFRSATTTGPVAGAGRGAADAASAPDRRKIAALRTRRL